MCGVTSALVILAAIAVSFAAMGPIPSFPFQDFPLNGVIVIQLYLAILAVPSLFLGAVVTERQRAEESLRQLSRKNEEALRIARMGHWEFDVTTRMFTFNDQYYTLHGTTVLEAGGYQMTAEEFARKYVHPDDAHLVKEHIQEAVAADNPDFELQAEARILRTNGESRWVTLWFRVEKDAQGKTIKLYGVNQDITERRRAEEALRSLNEQLELQVAQRTEDLTRTISRLQDEVARRVLAEDNLRKRSQMLEGFFQHTITPLVFMDKDFNLIRVNEAYGRADEREPEYFVGKNLFSLYPNEENQAIFERVVSTKQPYHAYAWPFIYPHAPERGTTYWNWLLTPLLDERGDVQFLVFSLEDVTERQKTFFELQERTRQLQQLTLELSQVEDRERKRLADILHDEVQQILAAAKFHLNLLTSATMSADESREIVEQVKQMLRDAIGKARSLSHELSPALYQVDLTEILNWLARHMQQEHGLTVHVEAHGQVDSSSEPLKTFLYKVAQELLFNVVKHAGVHEARIRLRRMGRCIYLSVTDQGRGFDPQGLKEARGFGLLSIRERVQLLGGRMKIRSVRNVGSRFLIAVPDEDASQVTAQTERTKE